ILLLLIHASVTLILAGVSWFMQVVHLPLFRRVGDRVFARYMDAELRVSVLLVAGLALVELLTAVSVLLYRPGGLPVWMPLAGLLLLVPAWVPGLMMFAPSGRLTAGFNGDDHRRLLQLNRVRVLAWTSRSVLVVWMLAVGLPAT
ncbi:MAG: hypothetical protein O7C98_11255, partial [Planctomycetota bacterium]|nr:hypothetical protein [Planctomycetota bacterium]